MKEIQLTQGFVAIIDDGDFERVNQYKWQVLLSGKKAKYATRFDNKNRKRIYLHRFITNADSGEEIDHINHDGLDNRRENLRTCTREQNMRNRPTWRKGYKGVRNSKSKRNPFTATIYANKRRNHLGSFPTAELAAMAYDEKAKEYFGAFACLNFPDKIFS
jgi:hypothetical protein